MRVDPWWKVGNRGNQSTLKETWHRATSSNINSSSSGLGSDPDLRNKKQEEGKDDYEEQEEITSWKTLVLIFNYNFSTVCYSGIHFNIILSLSIISYSLSVGKPW
jgi:hypothetical protein